MLKEPKFEQYSPYWLPFFSRSLKSTNPLKRAVANIFQERTSKEFPEIWAAQSGLKLSESDSDAILSSLESGLYLCQQEIIQNAFRQGLTAKNIEETWRIALPPLRQLITSYANLIKPHHFVLLKPLCTINKLFSERLAELFDADRDTLAGAIVFAAAAFDGLVDRNRLDALLRIEPKAISINREACVINLGENGLWFPRAVSQALLFAYQRRFALNQADERIESARMPPLSVKQSLAALSNFLDLESEERCALQNRLASLCRAFHGTVYPGYLLAYTHGINSSNSLTGEGYIRLISGEETPGSTPNPTRLTVQDAADLGKRANGPREKTMRKIRQILESLGHNPQKSDLENAKDQINQLINPVETWPIQRALAEWVLGKIDDTYKKDNAWSSLVRYYSALWYPLFISSLNFDFTNASIDSAEAWIEDALEQHKTSTSQLYFQQILPDFLGFLENRYGFPKIELKEIGPWIRNGIRRVNADWITPREFDSAIELLKSGRIVKDDKLAKICILVARICYRMGTRRREPLQAKIMDLQISKTPELIIRESLFGTLKSDQAVRRLPLGLMPDDEALELLTYAKERLTVAGPHAPLFASHDDPSTPLDHEKVFRYIKQALQLATKRTEVVIHLLRHSCANCVLLQLEAASQSIVLPVSFDTFSHPNFSAERCVAVKKAIFGSNLRNVSEAGEKNLFAVSLLLGHLSPSTTLKSYIHILDLLIYIYSESAQPIISDPPTLAASMNLRQSSFYDIALKLAVKPANLDFELLLPEIQKRFNRTWKESINPS